MKKVIDKAVEILAHKKPRAPSDASVYDIVVVGSNIGAVLSKNISHFTHGHKTLFVATQIPEQPMDTLRVLYERTFISPVKYFAKTAAAVCPSAATSGLSEMARVVPSESRIELRSGRSVGYRQLVLAVGLAPDWDAIQGFREALAEPSVPVYANYDLPTSPLKFKEFITMANHGDIFFYIPPFPFGGEIESMNLLAALDIFRTSVTAGVMSPLYRVHVINANDRFASNSPLLSKFIADTLAADNHVHVQMNTTLKSIDSKDKKLTLEDASGTRQVSFHRLHVQIPSKAHAGLSDSGLITPDGRQVIVDAHTLNHSTFSNIFAIGDAAALPVQRSFLAGVEQGHIVRHNILEALGGEKPNARYEGQSSLCLFTGNDAAVGYVSPRYGSEKLRLEGYLQGLQYSLFFKKRYLAQLLLIATGKNPGPPRYKLGYPKFTSNLKKQKHSKAEAAHH